MSFSVTATSTYFSSYQYDAKAVNWKSNTVASSKQSDERKESTLNKEVSNNKPTQSTTQSNQQQTIIPLDNQATQDSNQSGKVMTGSQLLASIPLADSKVTTKQGSSQPTADNKTDTESSEDSNQDSKVMTGSQLLASIPTKSNEAVNSKDSKAKGSATKDNEANGSETKGGETLSEEEKQQVQELKKRDAEVKTHEQAHLSAGGSYVRGGASYSYETGPDGMKYATGGEVQIDTAPVEGDPEATIMKAQAVRRAALAPAQPSSQDQVVAAQASKMMQDAQAELMQRNMAESNSTSNEKGGKSAGSLSDKSTEKSSDKPSGVSEDNKSENDSNIKSTIEAIYQQAEPSKISVSEQINLVA